MNKSISHLIRTYGLHMLVWSLFMAYEIGMIGFFVGRFGHPLAYLGHYLIIILTFYLWSDYAMKWSRKGHFEWLWRFPLVLTVFAFLFTGTNFCLDYVLIHFEIAPDNSSTVFTKTFVFKNIFRIIYILGFATGYHFLSTYQKEKQKTMALETQKLNHIIEEERMKRALSKSHNDFLKAQINPHFLFNTLDYIYYNVQNSSPEAADAILTLSDMMRYAVDANQQDEFIQLEEEIEQVEKLIYLYQLRKNMELHIILDFEPATRQLRIIPLILMTLVENIFKHGNVSDQKTGIFISTRIENHNLVIETRNARNLRNEFANSTHSGIRNIKERLKFAYGTGVKASFEARDNIFDANIQIPIQALELQGVRKNLLQTRSN